MRLIAKYVKEKADVFEIHTVYEEQTRIEKVSKSHPLTQTLSRKHPGAIWFERKISDDFGIVFEDGYDKRPLLHHERFPRNLHPMRKGFTQKVIEFGEYLPYKYEAVRGDGVFQVSVGPIHAGIIEPGHFHFSQAGEGILHQEVRHFYKYRGIEKMLEGKSLAQAAPIVARISGNESIAYQIAFRDIVAQAGRMTLPAPLKRYHAFLLELERVIHHLTDLGFIPNDAGFGAALAIGSKLAEEGRREMKLLCGHRFGFDAIAWENGFKESTPHHRWIHSLFEQIGFFEEWIANIPSLWDRFDTTGILTHAQALKYDTVGVIARASGVAVDRREKDPFYLDHGFKISMLEGGDVSDRFKLRLMEIHTSLSMMRNFIDETPAKVEVGEIADGEYTGAVESSIGELFMAVEIKEGVIERFYVRDPSFINWQALHLMMPDNIIADFPLINKSCDLSYAGNDL